MILPLALSIIAQLVTALTSILPSMSRKVVRRSNRAPVGALPISVVAWQLSLADVAAIIDLVAGDEPGVGVLVLLRRDQVPVRGRHVLHPPHPHRVVDVAVDVDVLRPDGEGHRVGV